MSCDVDCHVLEGINWQTNLKGFSQSIIFIEEGNRFVNTEEFAKAVKGSNNYYVIVSRENLYNLPYSVEEIYGISSSGKYYNTKKLYQEMYHIYSAKNESLAAPQILLVEDANAGYEFFDAVCSKYGGECISAKGKSNILKVLKNLKEDVEVCVIADGAAFGSEMKEIYQFVLRQSNIKLYLPESFEWIILSSGLLESKEIANILQEPEKYIDSREYFSWEQFFTKLLMQSTEDTYMKYQKSKLNQVYLHEKSIHKVLDGIKGLDLKYCYRNPISFR